MANYKHILLAVDFSDHGIEVASRAGQLAELNHAQLTVVHVVENLPITEATYGPIPFDVDFTQTLLDDAKTRLAKVAAGLNVPEERRLLEMGSPKLEIVRVADENQIDLIVLGSHGRHGLALLLGSTANGVLHHANCDVLAVRLKND
ncbi:MAG: universal stress protein [Methylococcales bacterium]|nr:universal stress protein [Methylococcales bacterium]